MQFTTGALGPLTPISAAEALSQPLSREAFRKQVAGVMDAIIREVAEGSLRDIALEHMASGGKQVRVSIVHDLARAVGVDPARCVHVAAACELLHNATLIHDDLQDRDRVRRGQPTVWVRHGDDQAINAGDLLLMLPFACLAESRAPATVRVGLSRALARRAAATACGQADEQQLLASRATDWASWRAAAIGKTGQIFAFPFEAVALIAGESAQDARRIGDVATRLGVLFQAADDVLDLFGDKGRARRGNDLREGRVSALVAAHLACCPGDTRALIGLLARPRETTNDVDVARWAARFRQAGTLDHIAAALRSEVSALEAAALPGHVDLRPPLLGMAARLVAPFEAAVQGPVRKSA